MNWLKHFLNIRFPQIRTPEQRVSSFIINMRWLEFEQYISRLLQKVGYNQVIVTGRDGPDGGKDIVIQHADKRYLVQCKHWTQELVTVRLLREFYAVMTENGASGGYFVTLLGFTPAARDYVKNKPIKLVTLPTLVDWHRLIETNKATLKTVEIHDPQAPRCAAGILKKKRTGAKGDFWGCGEWPMCACKEVNHGK